MYLVIRTALGACKTTNGNTGLLRSYLENEMTGTLAKEATGEVLTSVSLVKNVRVNDNVGVVQRTAKLSSFSVGHEDSTHLYMSLMLHSMAMRSVGLSSSR